MDTNISKTIFKCRLPVINICQIQSDEIVTEEADSKIYIKLRTVVSRKIYFQFVVPEIS